MKNFFIGVVVSAVGFFATKAWAQVTTTWIIVKDSSCSIALTHCPEGSNVYDLGLNSDGTVQWRTHKP